jgi:hypothetical protein
VEPLPHLRRWRSRRVAADHQRNDRAGLANSTHGQCCHSDAPRHISTISIQNSPSTQKSPALFGQKRLDLTSYMSYTDAEGRGGVGHVDFIDDYSHKI